MKRVLEWLIDLKDIRLGRDAPLLVQWELPVPAWVLLALMLARPSLTEPRADLTWVRGSWAWRLQVSSAFDATGLGVWLLRNVTVVVGMLGIM